VEAALAPFVTGLRRRLTRDLDRLHAYHNDLHREASQRAAQLGAGDAARERESLRIASIGQEYRAKLDDLAHKYALRVTVEWVQTLELVMPVHRLTVQIRRPKAERVMALDWTRSPAGWNRRLARRAGRPNGRAWCATTRCTWSHHRGWRRVPAAAAPIAAPAIRGTARNAAMSAAWRRSRRSYRHPAPVRRPRLRR
jgi:tRNA A37 threonylcarbamoyladenosine biosynthesis protein TsaE